eukprot:1834914-Amphidinium_carterae.1
MAWNTTTNKQWRFLPKWHRHNHMVSNNQQMTTRINHAGNGRVAVDKSSDNLALVNHSDR